MTYQYNTYTSTKLTTTTITTYQHINSIEILKFRNGLRKNIELFGEMSLQIIANWWFSHSNQSIDNNDTRTVRTFNYTSIRWWMKMECSNNIDAIGMVVCTFAECKIVFVDSEMFKVWSESIHHCMTGIAVEMISITIVIRTDVIIKMRIKQKVFRTVLTIEFNDVHIV
jgi:hypothetical protein